ncbi:hypothetical protein AB4Y33_43430, partial [Paraburkholderia sp. BR14319]
MERIPILRLGDCLIVTIQVDMHDRLAIVLTEAATNILKHAGHGELLVRALEGAVELIALDSGPGM